jgi:hypothetical protein
MSPREFRRRYGAEDLPPDSATYPSWSRESNLIHLGARTVGRGWVDVTERELKPWGNFQALVGHDPGTLCDVSLILKAYDVGRSAPGQNGKQVSYTQTIWLVVDEITTESTTTEQHVAELLERAGERFGLNRRDWQGRSVEGPKMLVRADPYGNNDARPDRSCYTIFRNAGITIHPAAYTNGTTKPGRIPKNAGIEMVNTLLCAASNERRLYIARNDQGTPVAPKLVQALTESERDLYGKAEAQAKDENDQSHWPAALRYALWAIERPRLQQLAKAAA